CSEWKNEGYGRTPGTAAPSPRYPSHLMWSGRVVRGLARDRDVVRVRLAQPRGRGAHEARTRPQLLHVTAANIAHTAAETTHHLVDHVSHRALVRHPPFDSLRHQLPCRHLPLLEVPVGAAVLHRGEGPHP